MQPGFAFKKENLVAPVKDAPQPPAPKEPSSSSAELFDPTKNPDGTPVPAGWGWSQTCEEEEGL